MQMEISFSVQRTTNVNGPLLENLTLCQYYTQIFEFDDSSLWLCDAETPESAAVLFCLLKASIE